MEWIETTGATLDEAKERALDRLGVAEDEMEVEVLVEGSRSMFGLRRTEARLRARVRPTSPRPKVERRDRNRRTGQKGRSRNEEAAETVARSRTVRRGTRIGPSRRPARPGSPRDRRVDGPGAVDAAVVAVASRAMLVQATSARVRRTRTRGRPSR